VPCGKYALYKERRFYPKLLIPTLERVSVGVVNLANRVALNQGKPTFVFKKLR
jgi:hypothetical protein